jgi:broad specificity phosphatase PhoE
MRGWLDVRLNDRGRRQAEAVGRALANENLSVIYTSPLSRTFETAKALGEPHGLEPIVYEPIKDFHFGEWEGKRRDEIKEIWPDLYRTYDADPGNFSAPGGESLSHLHRRVLEGLEALVPKHDGKTVGLSSHAVTCQMALLAVQGLGPEKYWNVKQGNCAINVFHHGGKGWVIEKINDTCHLAGID